MGGRGEVDEPLSLEGAEAGADTAHAAPVADQACVQWVKDRIKMPGITPEMWSVEHDHTLSEFLTSPSQRRLLAFIDPVLGLSLQFNLPQEPVSDLQYLLKPAGAAPNMENIGKMLQFGSVRGAPVRLHRVLCACCGGAWHSAVGGQAASRHDLGDHDDIVEWHRGPRVHSGEVRRCVAAARNFRRPPAKHSGENGHRILPGDREWKVWRG